MRAFIALPIPDAVRRSLWDALAQLRAPAAGVTWVRAEHLHITLFFLGELGETQVARARELFASGSLEQAPFRVEVRGLAAFPPRGSPRVLFAEIAQGARECTRLYELLAPRVAGIAPIEPRPFTPHVTIGRVRDPRRAVTRAELARLAATNGEFDVERCVLYESILSRNGPEYHEIASLALSGR